MWIFLQIYFASIYFTVIYDTLTVPNTTAQPFMKAVSVANFKHTLSFFSSVSKVCPKGKKKKAHIAVSLVFVGVRMVGATRLERATSTTPR